MTTNDSDKPKPRRRWLQYTLRALTVLVVLVLLLCGWLAWTRNEAMEQRKAVAWVREIGGWVYYAHDVDEDGSIPMGGGDAIGPKWLRDFVGAEYFQEVIVVDLDNTPISDLTPLANLTTLERLTLGNTQVSDLSPLAKLTNLERLNLNHTPVSDLTPLANLTSLELLWLEHAQVSDLAPLEKLTNLERLYLDNTPVSEEQLEELRRALPNCFIRSSPPDPSP